jgi:hypothetical protein
MPYYRTVVSKPYYANSWADPWSTYRLSIPWNVDKPAFSVAIGGVRYIKQTDTLIPKNNWSHLVCTYDGSAAKIYINKQLVDTNEAPEGPIDYRDSPLYIGDIPNTNNHFYGKIDEVAIYNRALTLEEIQQHYDNGLEGKGYEETPTNHPPIADAGENITIPSENQYVTVIEGTATDPDNDSLTYRWLEGTTELSTGNVTNGEAYLNLNSLEYFSIGVHTLTLEVSDDQATASDDMILTIDNSAPHPAPTGSGVYEIFTPVTLGGDVSDFDGDLLTFEWLEGSDLLFSGFQSTVQGGDPVFLPDNEISDFSLGLHTITLKVNDGVNADVTGDIAVEIVDTTVPTLAPVPNRTILWPPNHNMVDIFIEANASDNSGSVTLSATVSSNEPEDGLGDGDMTPDWSVPAIDQETGIITLQLRSERSGSGDGRVYTITITATDDSNNSSQASVEIIVPHDKSKK